MMIMVLTRFLHGILPISLNAELDLLFWAAEIYGDSNSPFLCPEICMLHDTMILSVICDDINA